jgi:hypothetical protein
MWSIVGWEIGVLASAFAGSYLGGYLRKKGENLATHEDIDRLVDQVRAVTTATKEIEAKISSDVWDRQKRWELKRELLLKAAKAMAEADEALWLYDVAVKQAPNSGDRWTELQSQHGFRWLKATAALDEARLLVALVCEKEIQKAFDELYAVAQTNALAITQKDSETYKQSKEELRAKRLAFTSAIRNELGTDQP